MRCPIVSGGLVRHSTDVMLAYYSGPWSGFEAYRATLYGDRSMIIVLRTSA
jgi:hypothetical protein